MTFVRSLNNIKPPSRYDGVPFTSYNFLECGTEDGTYTTIDAGTITHDTDPSRPIYRNITTAAATQDPGFYRIEWIDASGAITLSSIYYIDDSAPSLIAELVRSEMPRTWDSLARSPLYGEELLLKKIESVKYGILPAATAASLESSYAKILLNYVAKSTALDLIPAAIEFWMREKVSISATGTNETTSFSDPIAALRDLAKKLTVEVEHLKGDPTIAVLLTRQKELPAIDDGAAVVDGQVTESPYDFPPAFQF